MLASLDSDHVQPILFPLYQVGGFHFVIDYFASSPFLSAPFSSGAFS